MSLSRPRSAPAWFSPAHPYLPPHEAPAQLCRPPSPHHCALPPGASLCLCRPLFLEHTSLGFFFFFFNTEEMSTKFACNPCSGAALISAFSQVSVHAAKGSASLAFSTILSSCSGTFRLSALCRLPASSPPPGRRVFILRPTPPALARPPHWLRSP